jgi:hypothetical protein
VVVLVVLSWLLLVVLVVLSCLLLLLVLKEALQEELRPGFEKGCDEKGCDFPQVPAAQNLLFPSEGSECALFFWRWLQ